MATIRQQAALLAGFANVTAPSVMPAAGMQDLVATVTNGGTAASVADGGTIAHGCPYTPTIICLTGSHAADIVTVNAVDGTNITVDIKKSTDGSAGTTQTVYWTAR